MFHSTQPSFVALLLPLSSGNKGDMLIAIITVFFIEAQNQQSDAMLALEKRYGRCINLADLAPDKAINSALEWQAGGGGVPARHCEAMALARLGEFGESAARLERIAEDLEFTKGLPRSKGKSPAAGPIVAADVWHQAANVWLLGSELDRAADAIDKALALVPRESNRASQYLIDRARISAAEGDYASAYEDLRSVEKKDPARRDILLYIASAARQLGYLDEADFALGVYIPTYPEDPAGFLELGYLREEQGRKSAARQSWLKVLDLDGDSPAADSARAALQRHALVSERQPSDPDG